MKTKGFSIIEIIIVIAVIGVIAALGYVYVNRSAQVSNSTQEVSTAVPEAPQITSTKDLDTATSTVEEINLDTTDIEPEKTDISFRAYFG